MSGLEDIEKLIHSGKKRDAWNLLNQALTNNPANEHAWSLAYSLAQDSKREAILERAKKHLPSDSVLFTKPQLPGEWLGETESKLVFSGRMHKLSDTQPNKFDSTKRNAQDKISSLAKLTESERKNKLDSEINRLLGNGAQLESRMDYSAVVVFGNKMNHWLHLILTIFTGGIWFFIWMGMILVSKYKAYMVSIDWEGEVTTTEIPRGV